MPWIIEHKTTSEDIVPGGTYWKRVVTMDLQPSIYIPGMRALGHDVLGVVYDLLRKPGQEPKKATPESKRQFVKGTDRLYANQRLADETPKEFGRRVLTEIGDDMNRYYQRGKVFRLARDLEEGAHDTWQTAGTLREARRAHVFPRNPDSCMKWGRACEYLPICSGEAEADDPIRYRKAAVEHEELDVANADPRVVLSQSALRCFRSCPRKYQLQYEQRIRSARLAEPLRRGRSVHGGLNVWWQTGGDLEAALAAIGGPDSDPFDVALERAMICGYHARWERPSGTVVAVEKEFVTDLVNPDTGAKSRTFALAGRVDVLVELGDSETVSPPDRTIERALERSVGA